MPSKPKTWKTIADQRRKENFVGRGEQQRVFQENFTGDEPAWMVLSITGEGGVGKSTLLKRYTQLAQTTEINANVVYCDDRQYTPVDAMATVAEQLEKLGIESKAFNERHKKYRETLQQIESDPSAPRGMVNVVMRGLTDFTVKSLRRVPGIGVAADYIDEQSAGDALADLAQYTISRWGNKDEVQLVREPEKILTPLFVDLLNKAAEDKRLVVMFDVFERTASTLSSWLIDLFGGKHGDISSYVSFTLSGRDPLEQHWTELAGLMTHLQLEPFTPEETAVYLSNQGITDETLVKQIHEDTGGLPVLVQLLASTNPQPGTALPDISKDAVERFLQWTPDDAKRHAALLAATPRQFNQELLQALLGEEQGKALFQWLAEQSFIRSSSERGYFYHEKVRALMLRHQKNTTPRELSQTYTALAEYFAKAQADLGLQGEEAYKSQGWRILELERVYHHYSAAPEKHFANILDSFLAAFLHRREFSLTVIKTAAQAMADSQCSLFDNNLEKLERLVDLSSKEEYKQVMGLIQEIQNARGISSASHSICFLYKGYANFLLNEYEEALADFTRAIELDEKIGWAIVSRGETYRLMERYEEALADFTRAIELDQEIDWAIASRGETYRLMKRYEEALVDFTRAIELDEKLDWVIASRGQTYQSMERYEEALVDFTHAIELDEKLDWIIASRGETYQSMKRYEEALVDFTRAIELNDKYKWAIVNRGRTYQSMKRYEEALIDFTRAIELDDKYKGAITSRGQTYQSMARYEEALADFARAIELDEKYDWAIAQRGETFRLMKRYEEALVDFTRAIELDDKYKWAIASRGKTHQSMNHYEEALVDFTCAINLDEKYKWAIAQRGETYKLMERYEEALADFTRAIELDDKYSWAVASRGVTYRLMKQYDNAIKDLTQAIELDEKNATIFFQRGETYRLMDRYEEALVDFTRAIELDDKNKWTIASRGRTYQSMERYEEALADFTRAIELDEKYKWAIASRGQTYQSMERYEEALADFALAIELDEEFAWAFAVRGNTYRMMNRYEEALVNYTRAIELDEKYTWVIASRAMTYRDIGKYDEALQDYTRAIELDEKYVQAYYGRGKTYQRMGKYELALSDLTNVIQEGEPTGEDFSRRASIYFALGDMDSAQKDLERVLSLECKKPEDHYGRGIALILANRIPESFAEFDIAFADAWFRYIARTDDLLGPIRDLPEFKALLAKYE